MNDERRDWGNLGNILNEARAIEDELRQCDVIDCPVCGLLLDENASGNVNCRMGHYFAATRPKVLS